MAVLIQIPASVVAPLKDQTLTLGSSAACSRCNASPAEFFEVHRLFYRVGAIKYRLAGKKFRISQPYVLKLPICETCYQSDFLTHPELMDRNASKLSKIARLHSFAWTSGALVTALGFLLLTPIVPETDFFLPIKTLWQLPVAMGVVILFLTWISQHKYQTRVLRELENKITPFSAHARAEIYTPMLDTEEDLSKIALQIKMDNDAWAKNTASAHGWDFELLTTTQ